MAIKETIPFNFDEIYSYVENKFNEKGYDVEEGSNTMQLVTAMSYLTSMLNANTAVNINETLLTQARKRNMVLRDARILGYELDHIKSYRYTLTLNFTEQKTHSIGRYTSFDAGGLTYYYMGEQLEDFDVSQIDISNKKFYVKDMSKVICESLGGTWSSEFSWATFKTSDIPIGFSSTLNSSQLVEYNSKTAEEKLEYYIDHNNYELLSYIGVMKKLEVREGKLNKYEDNGTLIRIIETQATIDSVTGAITEVVQPYIDVPFTNIEEDGLDVFLTYVDENGTQFDKEEWKKSSSFMIDKDTVLNKEYVRLDDIDFKTPRIHFKLGEIGKELRVGTFVYINALTSSGVKGEMLDTPKPNEINCEVVNYELILQGANEESIESVKQNAPLFHNTANRVVTKPDYIAFCNRQSQVKDTDVWDGHDEFPKQAGNIWFSFIPSTNTRKLTPVDSGTNSKFILQNTSDKTNWNVEDAEIDAVWSYLDDFKIPTMIFHHRNPVYMDFNYNIEIIKYGLAATRKDQHKALFDIIDEYFKNEAESYKFEYFGSNLTRRIDDLLTDNTGFNHSLETNIHLSDSNITEEIEVSDGVYKKEVRIHLGMPYENVINDDYSINTEKLPLITTPKFVGNKTLSVDFSTPNETITLGGGEELVVYNIRLGSSKVGEYRVFNIIDPDIEIILDIKDTNGIPETALSNILTMNVKYPSPNIKFSRNTIPRLKSVNFI